MALSTELSRLDFNHCDWVCASLHFKDERMTNQAPEADPVNPMGENGRGNRLLSLEFLLELCSLGCLLDFGFRPLKKDISIFSGR